MALDYDKSMVGLIEQAAAGQISALELSVTLQRGPTATPATRELIDQFKRENRDLFATRRRRMT